MAVCDGGVVIDLSDLEHVAVDVHGRTARVQPGLRWGELDAATRTHGRTTTGGIVTATGAAGLTLGGGVGWLMRRHALTRPQSTGGAYVNFLGDMGHDQVRAACGKAKYHRPGALEARYDPHNLLRSSQSIRPRTRPEAGARSPGR